MLYSKRDIRLFNFFLVYEEIEVLRRFVIFLRLYRCGRIRVRFFGFWIKMFFKGFIRCEFS